MIDIFSQGKQLNTVWAKFDKIGDSAQGTYIGKREAQDNYNNKQIIYELLQEDGNIVNVGVRDAKVKFHQQMDSLSFGQIVGIRLTEQVPNTKGNPTNILSVFADSKIKNEAWLQEQSEKKAMMSEDGMNAERTEALKAPIFATAPPSLNSINVQASAPSNVMPNTYTAPATEDTPFASQPTDADKIKTIYEFAQAKLGVTDPMAVKDAVMEKTGLAFIASNFDKMIDLLRQM